MTDSSLHLRDDQLLLYASGEPQAASAELARGHLESCAQCQARLHELEKTLGEFTQAQRLIVDRELPSAVGPRALLRAQIADLSARSSSPERSKNTAWSLEWSFGQSLLNWRRATAFASLALLVMLAGGRAWRHWDISGNLAASGLTEKPNARFTPGFVVATTQKQVCVDSAETPISIPAALKTRVLQLYGVASEQSDAYEVDYLITPELGGATDIRNLWPEPYDHTVWNAHVKDRLENRLREMVCHGDIDLATAQHDISTDWIAAYRKYFHAEVPVPNGSS
jgi:hypothetical protein